MECRGAVGDIHMDQGKILSSTEETFLDESLKRKKRASLGQIQKPEKHIPAKKLYIKKWDLLHLNIEDR